LLRVLLLLCLSLLLVQAPSFGCDLSPGARGGEWLDREAARAYLVALINRDRASQGLKPVELDAVATRAGQEHAEEMALAKYVSHWDVKGRKPDQRYSEAGGQGAVSENVLVTHDFAEGEQYKLAAEQLFCRSELERIEALFFNEQAPNDGHRRNILNPDHNKVGIGLSLTVPGNRVTCTEEFVNQYGSFAKLPSQQGHDAGLALSGQLPQGVELYSVDIYRDQSPRPMTARELKATHSYTLPAETVARYFPPPYMSPARMNMIKTREGEKFSLSVQPGPDWKPGLYYVVVWVKKADRSTPVISSSRTVAIN